MRIIQKTPIARLLEKSICLHLSILKQIGSVLSKNNYLWQKHVVCCTFKKIAEKLLSKIKLYTRSFTNFHAIRKAVQMILRIFTCKCSQYILEMK